jgi:hypothetical protein
MRRAAFALIAVTLCAAPALAQPAPWQPERLTAGWTFTPGAVAGLMWDSNVTVQNQGNPHLSASSILLSPRGEIDFNGRRTHMNAGYAGALEQYRQLNALDRYEQHARFDLRHQSSERVQWTGSTSYILAPTTDRLEVGDGVLPFVDVGSRLFDATGGVTVALSRRTTLQAQYRFQDVAFDRSESPSSTHPFLANGYAHEPLLRVMHQITERLSVGGTWQYRHANVGSSIQPGGLIPPLGTTSTEGVTQTFDVQDGTGDLSYQVSGNTTATAGAGVSYLRVSNTSLSATGPAFHGGVTHHAGQLVLDASYRRAFVPSFGLGGLTANQSMAGDAYLPFAKGRYFVSGSVTYSRTSPVTALGVGYQLDSLWVNASAGYAVSRWLRAEGFLTRSRQDSTARGLFERTRVGIQFVTFTPLRID